MSILLWLCWYTHRDFLSPYHRLMWVWGDGWAQLSVKSRMVEDLERRLETAVAAGKKAGDRVISLEAEAAQAEKKLTKTKEKCQELTFKISNLEVCSYVDQPLFFPCLRIDC